MYRSPHFFVFAFFRALVLQTEQPPVAVHLAQDPHFAIHLDPVSTGTIFLVGLVFFTTFLVGFFFVASSDRPLSSSCTKHNLLNSAV